MKHLLNQIKKEIKKDFFDYLVLITGGVFFLIFLRAFSDQRLSMFIVIMIFCFFYICWGIYHHSVNKILHLKNVVEYILIGFIMLFISILLLL